MIDSFLLTHWGLELWLQIQFSINFVAAASVCDTAVYLYVFVQTTERCLV